MFTDQLRFLIFLLFLVAVYPLFRKRWLLAQQQADKRPRKPAVLRPKREQDCRFCQVDKQKMQSPQRELPIAWSLCKGKGEPKKQIKTVYLTYFSLPETPQMFIMITKPQKPSVSTAVHKNSVPIILWLELIMCG